MLVGVRVQQVSRGTVIRLGGQQGPGHGGAYVVCLGLRLTPRVSKEPLKYF